MLTTKEWKQSSKLRELELENQKLINELNNLKRSDLATRSRGSSIVELDEVYKLRADLLRSQECASDYRKRIETLESTLSVTYSQVEQAQSQVQLYQNKLATVERELSQIRQEKLLEHQNTEVFQQQLKDAEVSSILTR